MKNKRKNITFTLVFVIGIILLLNILAESLHLRLDLTQDNRYTLSKATKSILKSLEKPVTITAYFSEDLPPDIAKTRRYLKETLVEYSNLSDGMVVYEFVNPNESEKKEMEAQRAGVQPVLINVREKDQQKQQRAYMGAKVHVGDMSEVIPLIQPGASMEYDLSSSIKKIAVSDKPRIGFITGHGEPSLRALGQVRKSLEVLYSVEAYPLDDSLRNINDFKTLVWVNPTDSIPTEHIRRIDEYLAGGGNILIAYNRVEGDLSNASGKIVNTGLETWLQDKGLVVDKNFVIDASCGAVSVRQQVGPFSMPTQIQFPYLPKITNFAEHPITEGLEAVILPFASTITYTGDTSLNFKPLAYTSKQSGTQPAPIQRFNINKEWTNKDFPLSKLTVGGLLSGNIVGDTQSNLVLFSDGDFAVSGEGQNRQQLGEDNVNLLVNSVDFLSDDTGLIELRTKGVTSRPLEQLEDGQKTFLKYLNFLLPILLIIIYGITRMQMNRNKRIKRMEEGYVK